MSLAEIIIMTPLGSATHKRGNVNSKPFTDFVWCGIHFGDWCLIDVPHIPAKKVAGYTSIVPPGLEILPQATFTHHFSGGPNATVPAGACQIRTVRNTVGFLSRQ